MDKLVLNKIHFEIRLCALQISYACKKKGKVLQ